MSAILASSTDYDESTSKEIVDNISNTIDLIQDNFEDLQQANYSIEQFLSLFTSSNKQSAFLVLKDIHHHLDNPKVISLLKTIALKNIYDEDFFVTIFIVSTKLVIPVELEKLITVFDTPLPEKNEIIRLIQNFATDYQLEISTSMVDELALYLKGFSEFEIIQILILLIKIAVLWKESI